MKKLKISLFVMTVCVLVSCSNKSNQAAQNSNPGGGGGSSTATVAQSGINFTGYPMNATNQTITWFASNGYLPNTAYGSAKESPFHAGLQEMLGVKIDWQFPVTGTDTNQAFNLVMTNEKLPDVIFHGLMKDAQRYMDEGTIYDLTPYIQQWAPTYYKWLQTNPEYDRTFKTDQGKYYGFGFFRESGGWNDTYLGPVVRKDWLDECGLPLPETIDDWDKTLRTFKTRYGAVLSFARSRVADYGTGISGAFGAYTMLTFKLYVDDSRKIQSATSQPQWRDYIAKLNEWWRDGLLDQDFMTNDDTMTRTNALNGKMGVSITSMGQLSNWVKDAEGSGNGSKWIGLQYPHGADGSLSMVPGGYGIGTNAAVITTSCPQDKLELVMRTLDYAYSEAGNLYWNFGKQGVSWEYDANGKPAYLPLVTNDPDGLNNAIDKFGGSTWSGNCIQATLLLYLKNTQQAIDANDLWFYPNEAVSAKWTVPPGVTLTPDESSRAAELQNTISTYSNEMAIKFITGQEPLSNFDSFVARVNQMGLPELLTINQTGYNRYLAR
jgi:putative aldouronate transport system substrate-binding protein